ncbi:hypothetical protein CRG98_037386 [Punica granatum]|uniref:MBD domain-containing protein n=1 Tax=Punica granatum TaxID=22663 RepID=A0A2I0IFS4_PUNGR|nr:hypothetical protein CRG98_037386 [Punica granatum]
MSSLIGIITTSFELPNDFDTAGIDLNKLEMPLAGDDLNLLGEKIRQFSFTERLQGWRLEWRARTSRKYCDMYYYNDKAKKVFRSIKEVVNFMMFEAYPKLQGTKNDYFKNWYFIAKAEAETTAREYGKQNGLDVLGPILHPTLNFSTLLLSSKENRKEMRGWGDQSAALTPPRRLLASSVGIGDLGGGVG